MIPKREGELKSAFTEELKRQCPSFVVILHATAGAPDRSIHGAGQGSSWEFKHATPDFESPGIQELFCMRLDEAHHCRYVLWWENGSDQRTMIVRPRAIFRHTHTRSVMPYADAWVYGFNHHWLVCQVKKAHGLPGY